MSMSHARIRQLEKRHSTHMPEVVIVGTTETTAQALSRHGLTQNRSGEVLNARGVAVHVIVIKSDFPD